MVWRLTASFAAPYAGPPIHVFRVAPKVFQYVDCRLRMTLLTFAIQPAFLHPRGRTKYAPEIHFDWTIGYQVVRSAGSFSVLCYTGVATRNTRDLFMLQSLVCRALG